MQQEISDTSQNDLDFQIKPSYSDVIDDVIQYKESDFYYETGAEQSYGISATVNAGKSIFWKRTKCRLLSDAIIKK